ncbi:MAG: MFS transporter [Balneolaceae bacterium]
MNKQIPNHVLPVIVFSQFAGTSLWFAGNAVVPDLIRELSFSEAYIGYITMAVQAGFILGTLVFAVLSVADRFSPVKVFLACSVLGALFNTITIFGTSTGEVVGARILTGFFLAGIYPVGMKVASDWHKEGLGKALGYLVGALVIGTAFPHLLRFIGDEFPWRFVMIATSLLSISGGLLLYVTVADGPFRGKSGGFNPAAILSLFKSKNFRSAAFGYFGHMWELYTFWAFTPVLLAYYSANSAIDINISLWSFIIIGIGGISCAAGGHFSLKYGSKKIAFSSLMFSGICCLLIPFLVHAPLWVFLFFLLMWGAFVVSDSPQFSAMVASSTDRSLVATGLTIVNCIGFSLTILSIQLVTLLWVNVESVQIFWLIAIGPLFGLISLKKFKV